MVASVGKPPPIGISVNVRTDSAVAAARLTTVPTIATTEADASSRRDIPSAAARMDRTEIVARIKIVRNSAGMEVSA